MAERRHSYRARVALSCKLKRDAGSPIWAETIDVSEGGMSVRAARPLPEDETVDFDLADADVHGRARVLRHPSPRVYGLRFETLAGAGRDRLMTLLDTHPTVRGQTRV
jgi:c-di-GMP-binding flagellar brake protein YcgR